MATRRLISTRQEHTCVLRLGVDSCSTWELHRRCSQARGPSAPQCVVADCINHRNCSSPSFARRNPRAPRHVRGPAGRPTGSDGRRANKRTSSSMRRAGCGSCCGNFPFSSRLACSPNHYHTAYETAVFSVRHRVCLIATDVCRPVAGEHDYQST